MNNNLRIGELLKQAGLITEAQIQVALQDRTVYQGLYRLGEIFALRGWLQQETVEFFAEDLAERIDASDRLRLGEYLTMAKLLTPGQVGDILQEQQDTNARLGAIAVERGWLGQQTIDFFLENFFPEHCHSSGLSVKGRIPVPVPAH